MLNDAAVEIPTVIPGIIAGGGGQPRPGGQPSPRPEGDSVECSAPAQPGRPLPSRTRETAIPTRSAAASTSAPVVNRPRLRRRAEPARSPKPMAARTWEGAGAPLEQALPAEAETPSSLR